MEENVEMIDWLNIWDTCNILSPNEIFNCTSKIHTTCLIRKMILLFDIFALHRIKARIVNQIMSIGSKENKKLSTT